MHAHAIDHIKASFLSTPMTDFFSNLGSGIRFPDARIGGSNPLPTSLSGPAGINGDPDGRYNFNGNLLDGVSPYAGPDGGRMGSDRNYQQVPHRVQHIVPKLYLPKAQFLEGKQTLELSHAVDQGDIAFVIVSERIQHLVTPNAQFNGPRLQLPARNAFVNLPTVNYLLAGLQRLDETHNIRGKDRSAWAQLADDLQYDFSNPNRLAELLRLVSTRLLPYGICAGSEHQGGKHETGIAPVQAAANHVTTMTVDGQNRDLVNYWRASNISAGDTLIFRLERVPTKQFTLNHYYKQMAFEDFGRAEVCYQLVPDVFRMSYNPRLNLEQKMPQPTLTHANTKTQNSVKDNIQYDYRLHGYWRIGQMFHHRNQHDMECNNYSDDKVFLRGQLMQVTFAPMWIQLDDRLPLDGKLKPHQHYASTLPQSTKKRKTEGGGDGGGGKRNSMISGHAYGSALRSPPAPAAAAPAAAAPAPPGATLGLEVITKYNMQLIASSAAENRLNQPFFRQYTMHVTRISPLVLTDQDNLDIIMDDITDQNWNNIDYNWPYDNVWQQILTDLNTIQTASDINAANFAKPSFTEEHRKTHDIVQKISNELTPNVDVAIRSNWESQFRQFKIDARSIATSTRTLTGGAREIDTTNLRTLVHTYQNATNPCNQLWINIEGVFAINTDVNIALWTTYAGQPPLPGGGVNPNIWQRPFIEPTNIDISSQFSSNMQPESSTASTNTQNISKPKIVVRKAGDVLSSLMAGDNEDGKNEGGGKSAKKKVYFGKRGEKD